ncbi:MAG TPA: hypothetical protein VGC65_11100 [Bacteroidia bacterium]|jgi:hypothetical protein
MKTLNPISFFLIALSFTEIPVFASTILSLEDAAKRGLVKLSIKSKGGYTGDVIEMKIQNLTNQKLDLRLEAGRRLDSKKQDEQDILVTQAQEFFVNANQPKTLNVFGMCCQAHKSAPQQKSDYTVGKLADSNLIKLALFIDKNKYYTNYSAQQSVWVVSDDNSIGSIDDDDKDVKKLLREYVAKLTGKTIPAYDILYQSGNDGTAMGRATRIEGVFDYRLPQNCHATMFICNERGETVQVIFENIATERGEYKLYFTFRTKDLPQGTYYARVNADGMLQKQMTIEF